MEVGGYLSRLSVYIVKLDKRKTLLVVFTLILSEGKVKARKEQIPKSLEVSDRDKYSLQLTPEVKGNWERWSRERTGVKERMKEKERSLDVRKKRTTGKQLNGEAKREWKDEVISESEHKIQKE